MEVNNSDGRPVEKVDGSSTSSGEIESLISALSNPFASTTEEDRARLRTVMSEGVVEINDHRAQSVARRLLESNHPTSEPKALRELAVAAWNWQRSTISRSRFVGREQQLTFLESKLLSTDSLKSRACNITGGWGIGKHHLALEFGKRHRERFHLVYPHSMKLGVFCYGMGGPFLGANPSNVSDLYPLIENAALEKPLLLIWADPPNPCPLPTKNVVAILTSREPVQTSLGAPISFPLQGLANDEAQALLKTWDIEVNTSPLKEAIPHYEENPRMLAEIGMWADALGESELAPILLRPETHLQMNSNACKAVTEKVVELWGHEILKNLGTTNPPLFRMTRALGYLGCSIVHPSLVRSLWRAFADNTPLDNDHLVRVFDESLDGGNRLRPAIALALQEFPFDATYHEYAGSTLAATVFSFDDEKEHPQMKLLKASKWAASAKLYLQAKHKVPPRIRGQLLHQLGALETHITCKYSDAITHLETALTIRRKLAFGKSPEVAETLHELGCAYEEMARHQEALKCLQEAVKIRTALFGREQADTATTLNHLGWTLSSLSRFEEARAHHQAALEIRKKVLGAQHPLVADSLAGLSCVARMTHQRHLAINLNNEAEAICIAVYGKVHPSYARRKATHGRLCNDGGAYAHGFDCLQEALAIYRKFYPESHPHIARLFSYFGDNYTLRNQHENALKMYQAALGKTRNLYGQEHPFVVDALDDLALCRESLKQYENALQEAHIALRMARKTCTPRDWRIGKCLSTIGSIRVAKGEHEKALQAYEESLPILRANLGPYHRDIARVTFNIGLCYRSLGDSGKAKRRYEWALKIAKKAFPPGHETIQRIQKALNNFS